MKSQPQFSIRVIGSSSSSISISNSTTSSKISSSWGICYVTICVTVNGPGIRSVGQDEVCSVGIQTRGECVFKSRLDFLNYLLRYPVSGLLVPPCTMGLLRAIHGISIEFVRNRRYPPLTKVSQTKPQVSDPKAASAAPARTGRPPPLPTPPTHRDPQIPIPN